MTENKNSKKILVTRFAIRLHGYLRKDLQRSSYLTGAYGTLPPYWRNKEDDIDEIN